MKTKAENIKAGIMIAILIALPIGAIYTYGVLTLPTTLEPILKGVDGGNDGDMDGDGYLEDWYVVQEISSEEIMLTPLGELNVPAGETGWMASFHLDYAETPETCLASNDSGAGYAGWIGVNISGYVDTDDTATDLDSENPAYIVVRVQHNDTAKDGATWNWSRFRCRMNITGDETIDNRYESDNSTNDGSNSGDAVISSVLVDRIYINYFWDDNSDGYRITDDGLLTWSIIIEERY